MSTVQVAIDIEAPIERVWETILDPQRLKDWVTIHKSVSKVSDAPGKPGATMDQVLVIRGVSFKVHWTLVDVSAPTTAQWEGRGPARSLARIRYELAAKDESKTRFEYTNEFNPPGGMLGNVASRVVVGAASEREAKNSLTALKKLLERG